MVLNEKLSAKPRGGLVKRTLLYVLGFGLGSMAIAGCMSFAMMAITDGVMPSKEAKPASTVAPKIIGTPTDDAKKGTTKLSPKPASKARRGRANQVPKDPKKSSARPL